MVDRIPMTRTGYEKIKAEVKHMEDQMGEIAERIAEAREEGDLKENAEYHAQRENQGMMQAKINERKSKLSRAEIIDVSTLPKDQVVFGCTVKVMDTDLDEEEVITLVGAGEEDYDRGHYLATSPIGQGLLGLKVGEEVSIDVPRGVINFKVLEIRFDNLE
jgi:transcription elongation factor GreA